MSADRVFLRQYWSRYLGELRPRNDIYVDIEEGITPTPTLTQSPTPSVTPAPSCDISYSIVPTPTPSAEALTPEYIAILTRATELGFELPTNTEQRRQNQFIVNLKSDGVWSKLGKLWVFSQNISTISPAFTFINWITPSDAINVLNRSTTGDTFPSFVNLSGWTFNQNNRMRTGVNFNQSTNPIIVQSGGSEGVYIISAGTSSVSGNNMFFQTDNNGWNNMRSNNTTAQSIFQGTGLSTAVDLTGTGFRAVTLTGSTTANTSIDFYVDTNKLSRTKTGVDSVVGGGSMWINGLATNSFNWMCSLVFAGRPLTDTEMNNLRTRFETYLNS